MKPDRTNTAKKNKIGLTAADHFIGESKAVVLNFPYKDDYLEGGLTKAESGSKEIFWNTHTDAKEVERLLSPKLLTGFTRYDKSGAKKVRAISDTDNLFIRGNNLLALHTIRERFANKVKLIYIDPPYNTGNDHFSYNDSFDHATWLTFMKNRLEIAKELLSDDGFILLQIDNNEGPYLKVLCDEIFGRENYRNSIIVKKGTKSLQKQFDTIQKLNAGFDTIFLYTKQETTRLPHLYKELEGATASSWNNHWRGTDRPTMRFELFGITPKTGQWRWKKERTETAVENYKKLIDFIKKKKGATTIITDELIDEYYQLYLNAFEITDPSAFELVRLSKNKKPEHYIPPRTKILLSENWMDLSVAGRITNFEHEKNEEILQRILQWLTVQGDIVLDFFTGSGSTIAVAHKLQRQYIGIEQMNFGTEDATLRLQSIMKGDKKGISTAIGWKGGGSFVYMELATSNKMFLTRIQKATPKELDTIYNTLLQHPYCIHQTTPSIKTDTAFLSLTEKEKKKVLIELLTINTLYISWDNKATQQPALKSDVILLNHFFYE